MTENNTVELHEDADGQLSLFKEELTAEQKPSTDEELKKAIEEQMRKIQRQNLLIGSQTMCSVILQKIVVAQSKPGKMTMNDYKRLVKDIQNFCETGLSRKVNVDGETEPKSKTTQN